MIAKPYEQRLSEYGERFCETCNDPIVLRRFPSGLEDKASFKKRRFCGRKCYGLWRQSLPSVAKTKTGHRSHASKKIPHGLCEECEEKDGRDVHHIDENTANNSLDNLRRLCRSCHLKKHRHKSKCVCCDSMARARRLCNLHYVRMEQHGVLHFFPTLKNG